MEKKRGPWTIRQSRKVYENSWMSVHEHAVTRPDGHEGIYGVMSPKQLALAILPVFSDGSVMLVGQHRFTLDRYSWEIPEGGGAMDTDPQVSAARELREETGLMAARWQRIFESDLSNSITDERAIGFLATGLTAGRPDPEGCEDLQTRRAPFRDVLDEVYSGKIEDVLTVAMTLKAYYMAQENMLDPVLSRAMLNR